MNELRSILKRVGVTSVYVTHDQQEAFAVSDRVIVMRQGRVVQRGTPHDVYFRPDSPWVARFLGLTNLLPGRIVAVPSGPEGETTTVRTSLGELVLRDTGPYALDQEVTVLIRPEAARPAGEHPAEGECVVEGIVRDCSFRGTRTRLKVRFPDGPEMVFELASSGLQLPQRGRPIALALRPEAMSLLADGAT
jgi:ABC-type Fe3+/spermidine/putrescine transport system ATPase subunit